MRTRQAQEINNAAVSAIAAEVQSDIQVGKRYVEVRFTCKKANGGNKVAFYFHGGRMIENEGRFFASFRPLPWAKDRQGEFKLNADGSHQRNPVWAKLVSSAAQSLSPQDQILVAAAKSNPGLVAMLPAHIQEAVKAPEVLYQDFDLETWVALISQNMENVTFSFNVPSIFQSQVETLKNLVLSEESTYSLVMRFDLDEPIYGLSDLTEVYESEELQKNFPLKPTYVGFIQELTRQDAPKSAFINPALVNTAMDKAIAVADQKKESWLDSSFLSAQSAVMAERLAKIGTGKKAHHSILNDLNSAAEKGNEVAFKDAADLLTAVAERGQNPHLPVEKATALIKDAESKLVEPKAEVVVEEIQPAKVEAPEVTETKNVSSVLLDSLFD